MQKISSPDNLFHDGDPTTGALGTIVSAAFMNSVQAEIIAPIAAAGLTLDSTNSSQLLAAILLLIESKTGNYALDTGVANAYVVALAPAVTAYTNGLPVKFRATHANTDQSTLNAGAGPEPLLRDDGASLQPGDVPGGAVVSATYDSSAAAFLINSIVPSQIATQVAAILGASPQLGGTPTAPTPPQFDKSGKLATTAAVKGNGVSFSNAISIGASRNLAASDIGAHLLFSAATTTLTVTTPSSLGARPGDAVVIGAYGANTGTVAFSGCTYAYGTAGASASLTVLNGEQLTLIAESASTWRVGPSTAAMGQIGSFGGSLGGNGYQKLSGLIIQWGWVGSVGGVSSVSPTFPIAFPNAGLWAIASSGSGVGTASPISFACTLVSKTYATFQNQSSGLSNMFWFAIGY